VSPAITTGTVPAERAPDTADVQRLLLALGVALPGAHRRPPAGLTAESPDPDDAPPFCKLARSR
jgi:hypothetical protein